MKKTYAATLISLLLLACSSAKDDFLNTDSGRALMTCVSGGGSLDVQNISLDNQQKGVNVKLIKNSKNIELQFAVDKKLNQASLVGATIAGKKELTKFTLIINLELVCGGELASKIFPDEYRNLQMLNQIRRMLR